MTSAATRAGSTARAKPLLTRGMSEEAPNPETCRSMADVRTGVDATDAELVFLLARRFGYMRAAARIKADRGAVRDEERKAQVLANVARHAAAAGLPPVALGAVWDALIEQSIAYELDEWDRIKG